jgi:anti-sigma28 factor (negative regulator of flagellin synthesis)
MRLPYSLRRYAAAAPARAREVIRENAEAQASIDAISAPAGIARLDRIAELRQVVQQNRYQLDLEGLCRKLIDTHLSSRLH